MVDLGRLPHRLSLRVVAGRPLLGPEDPHKTALYVPWSLLSGLAFFVMGGSYWGRCYAFGLAFFALAALLPWRLAWAPLLFGALWTVALLSLGLYLRRLAADGEGTAAEPSTVQDPANEPSRSQSAG